MESLMCKDTKISKEQVEIKIISGEKEDWYYDLVGLPMKVIIFKGYTRCALCLSMLEHDMELWIKDTDFVVTKGKDIRKSV